jgi:beta-lactamase regulating signal transducer with metallopeptidase domain
MEAMVNALINAIGWSIFHSLWQGALIYGILFMVMMAFPKMAARTKHNLAFAAICVLFVAFVLNFFYTLKVPVAGGDQQVAAAVDGPAASMASLVPFSTSLLNRAEQLFPYLVAIYGIGLLLQVFVLASGFRKLLQLKKATRQQVPEAWLAVFDSIMERFHIRRNVGFYLSESVNVPLVIGYFKPIVLFPVALAAQLDIDQVEAILIHELSHIRRNDYLLNLVKMVIEAVLFFNPFVWLCSRFIQIEREHACDDLVLSLTGTPLTYAHALLKLELLKVKDTPALSLAASGESQHLYQRIKRITDMKTNYINPKQQILSITLALATIISLAWVSPKEEKKISRVAAPETAKLAIPAEECSDATIKTAANVRPAKAHRIIVTLDTPKKKKTVRIITVDGNGKKTEYKSINELPDSIKADMDEPSFFVRGFQNGIPDSASLLALRKNAQAMAERLNSPEQRAKWEKLGLAMRKQGELFEKRFNSPEQRAKLEQLGIKMRKQAELMERNGHSAEEQAKLRKLSQEMQKHTEQIRKNLPSPELQKEMKRLSKEMRERSKEMNRLMITPEMQKQIRDIATPPAAPAAPAAPAPAAPGHIAPEPPAPVAPENISPVV